MWRHSSLRVVAAIGLGAVTLLPMSVSASAGVLHDDPDRHQMGAGETLSDVAERYGVSVEALADVNGITDANLVWVGRWLILPQPGSGGSEGAGTPAATHVVASGETLSSIANRYGVTADDIASANDITDPHIVVIGRRLTIPAADGSGQWPLALRRSTTRQAYIPTFDHWAGYYGVPADLLKAMTWLESGWQLGAVSSTGAVGIGQLMPDTVDFMRVLIRDGSLQPLDPGDNIQMSARYLRWLLDLMGGSSAKSLAAYYQGFRSLEVNGIYAETLTYVHWVQSLRSRF